MTAPHAAAGTGVQQRVLGIIALAAGMCGLGSTLPIGSVGRAILLLVLLVSGAGSAVMCWLEVPVAAAAAGVIGVSIAAVVGTSTALAWLHWWQPTASCVALSVVVAASGTARLVTLSRSRAEAPPW